MWLYLIYFFRLCQSPCFYGILITKYLSSLVSGSLMYICWHCSVLFFFRVFIPSFFNPHFHTVDLLQMLEMNMSIAFPAAPLLTVILALVGKWCSSHLHSYLCTSKLVLKNLFLSNRNGSHYVRVFQWHYNSLLRYSHCVACWSVWCYLLPHEHQQEALAQVSYLVIMQHSFFICTSTSYLVFL